MVPITHEQNIICSKTRLDGTTHEQTINYRQLFAGHVGDSRSIEGKKKTHRMIIPVTGVLAFIFFLSRKRAEFKTESCNLAGFWSGRNFSPPDRLSARNPPS